MNRRHDYIYNCKMVYETHPFKNSLNSNKVLLFGSMLVLKCLKVFLIIDFLFSSKLWQSTDKGCWVLRSQCFIQLGLNEADTLKYSSILIY